MNGKGPATNKNLTTTRKRKKSLGSKSPPSKSKKGSSSKKGSRSKSPDKADTGRRGWLIACVTSKADKDKITKVLKKYEETSLTMWDPLFEMGDLITSVYRINLFKGFHVKGRKRGSQAATRDKELIVFTTTRTIFFGFFLTESHIHP